MKNSIIFDIQRFSVHDGPGIRTTVFIKGCPLNCLWCHNPESKSRTPEIMITSAKCIGCGRCAEVCPAGVHSFTNEGRHIIKREACVLCRACEKECVGALSICGKEMTADEVIDTVLKDKSFYDNSGGGMTLSGGEPLFSPELTLELLKKAKEAGLNTAIETSGFAGREVLKSVIPFTDLFLYDFKESDEERHKEYTGVSNKTIIANLEYLNEVGARVVLRCPIIPGYNDRAEHFRAIGELAERLSCIERVDVEPYHPLGKSKSEGLGISYQLAGVTFPEKETVAAWVAEIGKGTSKPVIKS